MLLQIERPKVQLVIKGKYQKYFQLERQNQEMK